MENLIDKREREKNLNEHSSENDMLRIIENNRRIKIQDAAEQIIELNKIEAEQSHVDEFGNTASEEIKAAYQKEIESRRVEIERLEEEIRSTFKQEDDIIKGGILAGNDPTSEYLQGQN